jgi:hypothetical protein
VVLCRLRYRLEQLVADSDDDAPAAGPAGATTAAPPGSPP